MSEFVLIPICSDWCQLQLRPAQSGEGKRLTSPSCFLASLGVAENVPITNLRLTLGYAGNILIALVVWNPRGAMVCHRLNSKPLDDLKVPERSEV